MQQQSRVSLTSITIRPRNDARVFVQHLALFICLEPGKGLVTLLEGFPRPLSTES